jgi:hypothetical protein
VTADSEKSDNQFDANEHRRVWLSHVDEPCPMCGYNLRHQTSDTCPECGSLFQLGLKGLDPRFGYFVCLIAPMIGVVGISALVWMTAIVDWRGATPQRINSEQIVLLTVGPVDLILAVFAFWKRFSFLAISRIKQLLLVFCSWSVHTIALAVWISSV